MPLEDNGPHDIVPGSVVGLTPKGIPEEVLLLIEAEELGAEVAIRFKTADFLDDVIAALERHRADVWGPR